MSFVALVWLLIERGGTPDAVGWLAAIYIAPVVVGGIAAGIVLDRFDRRRVLAADNLIRGVAIASVPLAAALGVLSTAQLFVVAGIYGLLYMSSIAGIPSMIPTLVDGDDLTTANAMESITHGIAGLVGPTIAGVVIAVFGAPVVLALDALTYAVFVVCLLAMRPPEPLVTARTTAEDHASPSADGSPAAIGIGPALRFLASSPAIPAIAIMCISLNLTGGIGAVVFPIYARDVLEGGSATYGLLLSALTAGELTGLIVVGAIRWRWPLGRSIAVGALTSGLILSLLVLRPGLPLILVVLVGSGIAESSLTPWAQTIRMRLIPSELRGRVFALLRTLMQSTRPIGAIAAGPLLGGGGPTPALIAAAALVAVPGAVGLFLPALGRGPTREPARFEPATGEA